MKPGVLQSMESQRVGHDGGDLPDPGIKPESPVSPALAGGIFAPAKFWYFTNEKKIESQEMYVQSLGQEVPLKEEIATPSSILAWKIPWMEEPGRL